MMEDGGIMVELGMRIIIAGGISYSKCRRDLLKVYRISTVRSRSIAFDWFDRRSIDIVWLSFPAQRTSAISQS